MTLRLLYRGPLRSCDYSCSYCPFGKERPDERALDRDQRALQRFLRWVRAQRRPLSILFAPSGEALRHRWYREALVELSHLPQVRRVAAQTNLSHDPAWLRAADPHRTGLWTSYHPAAEPPDAFLAKCQVLDELGVPFSVGLVGREEHLAAALVLRSRLSPAVYLWINGYQEGGPAYYDRDLVTAYRAIDPLFPLELRPHPSRGRACQAGSSAISVDGEGDVRRCLFVPAVIGNLYGGEIGALPHPGPCPEASCRCYIGYAFLEHLGLGRLFGAGLLGRTPALPLWRDPALVQPTLRAADAGQARFAPCEEKDAPAGRPPPALGL